MTTQKRAGLASDMAKDEHGFRITLTIGEVIRADRVDVATGRPSPRLLRADADSAAFTTLYGNEDAIAEVLRSGQEVTCLECNAAMLDVLWQMLSVLGVQGIRRRVAVTGIEALGASRAKRREVMLQRVRCFGRGPYDRPAGIVTPVVIGTSGPDRRGRA